MYNIRSTEYLTPYNVCVMLVLPLTQWFHCKENATYSVEAVKMHGDEYGLKMQEILQKIPADNCAEPYSAHWLHYSP